MILCIVIAYRCQFHAQCMCFDQAESLIKAHALRMKLRHSVGTSVGSVSSKYYVLCQCQAAHKLLLCGAAGAGIELAGRASGGRALVSASQVLPLASLQ